MTRTRKAAKPMTLRRKLALTSALGMSLGVFATPAMAQTTSGPQGSFGSVTTTTTENTDFTPTPPSTPDGPIFNLNETNPAAGQAGRLDVDLQARNSVIEWGTFNVLAGKTISFNNGAGTSTTDAKAVLNRVTGGTATEISGAVLTGTRNADTSVTQGANNIAVWIVNGSGIMVGAGANINTGGLVMSGIGLTDAQADAFRTTAAGSAYAVRFNDGAGSAITAATGAVSQINTNNGVLALIAPQITTDTNFSTNSGTGATVFAIASDVSLTTTPGGPLSITLNAGTALNTSVQGAIVGDRVYALLRSADAVNALLAVPASVTNATSGAGGVVVLSGTGQSGTLPNGGSTDDSFSTGTTPGTGSYLGSIELGPITLGANSATGDALLVKATGTTTLSGTVTGAATVGVAGAGGITLSADISSRGQQTYTDKVTLGADVALALTTATGGISFGGSVDGGHALSLTADNDKSFGGAVGATTKLTSVTSSGAGSTIFGSGAGSVDTTAAQSYGAVTLNGSLAATGTDGSFGAITGGAHALTLGFTGSTTLNGASGLTQLTSNAGGTTTLNGTITSTGTQTYTDNVVLGSNTTVAAGTASIFFDGTVNGGFALVANTTGTTRFNVVGQTTALASLTTDTGGTTELRGNVTTSGGQTYNDAVQANVAAPAVQTLTSTGAGDIRFLGSLDGTTSTAGSRQRLTIATSGNTTITGAGGTTPFGELITDAGGTSTVSGTITAFTINFGDPLTTAGGTTLTGGTGGVTFNSFDGADAKVVTSLAGITGIVARRHRHGIADRCRR